MHESLDHKYLPLGQSDGPTNGRGHDKPVNGEKVFGKGSHPSESRRALTPEIIFEPVLPQATTLLSVGQAPSSDATTVVLPLTSEKLPTSPLSKSLLPLKYLEILNPVESQRLADSLRGNGLERFVGVPLLKLPRTVSEDAFWKFVNEAGCGEYAHTLVRPREFVAHIERLRGARRLNGAEYQEGHTDPVSMITVCNLLALGIDEPETLTWEILGGGLHDGAEDMPHAKNPQKKNAIRALKRDPFTAEELASFYTMIEIRGRSDYSLAPVLMLWGFAGDLVVNTKEYRRLFEAYRSNPSRDLHEKLFGLYQTYCYQFADDGMLVSKFRGRTKPEMETYVIQLFSKNQPRPQRWKAGDVAQNSMESALGVECFLDRRLQDFLVSPRETDLNKPEGLRFAAKLFKVAFNRGIENIRYYQDKFLGLWNKGVISEELFVALHYWNIVRLQPALVRAAQYLVLEPEGKKILEESRKEALRKYEKAVQKAGGPESAKGAAIPQPIYLVHQVAEYLRRAPIESGAARTIFEPADGFSTARILLTQLGDPDISRTHEDEQFLRAELEAYQSRVSRACHPGDEMTRVSLNRRADEVRRTRLEMSGGANLTMP